MSVSESPITFVRTIKGAPASVLWALLLTRRDMGSRELQMWTGYNEESVIAATRVLRDLGWISARSPQGPWSLAAERQLPIPEAAFAAGPGGSAEEAPKRGERCERPQAVVSASLKALSEAGIREPVASKLAQLAHVNPEYVRAHVQRAAADGFSLGTAVYRIQHAWPAPPPKRDDSVEAKIRRFLGEESE